MKWIVLAGVSIAVCGVVLTNLARSPPSANMGMLLAGVGGLTACVSGAWWWWLA